MLCFKALLCAVGILGRAVKQGGKAVQARHVERRTMATSSTTTTRALVVVVVVEMVMMVLEIEAVRKNQSE